MMQLKVLFQTFRPSFLVLTPVCVFLGLATAMASGAPINFFMFFLVLIGAMFAHISVNMLNEYHDFKSGLDLKTEKTAFSGGSGALPAHPDMAGGVLTVGLLFLLLTILIGVYLVMLRGMQIMPIGLLGVVLIVAYTQWLNRLPLLCLLAPGLGLGVLMVVGTQVILTGEHSRLAWLVSLVPFLLVNNLLLLNQYPDIQADASAGRNTFPIAFGLKNSNGVFAVFSMAAYSLILFLIVQGHLPTLGIIVMLPLALSLFALIGAIKYEAKIGDFPRYMAANVAAALLTPLLLGISLISA